jgi:hypothetical protein
MLSLRQKTVNVSREILLERLKENFLSFCDSYVEALSDYKKRLQLELQELHQKVSGDIQDYELVKLKMTFNPPQDKRREFLDVIEMLELSVDENINLDHDAFRAYFKNEWDWMEPFNAMMVSNKAYIAGKI